MGVIIALGVIFLIALAAFALGLIYRPDHNDDEDQTRGWSFTVGVVMVFLFAGTWGCNGGKSVDTGKVVIPTAFGKVVHETFFPGFNLTWPWYNTDISVSTRLQNVETSTQRNLKITSKDKLPMVVSVTHPFSINANYVDYLLGLYGLQDMEGKVRELVQDVGDYSTRNSYRLFTGEESSGIKTDTVQFKISTQLEQGVISRFVSQGIPKEIAEKLLIFAPSIVKVSNLPDRIVQEKLELSATIIEYQRKTQLLENAKKDAEIAGTDGIGVRQFLDRAGVSRDATPGQIADLMRANATLNQAESFRKLVESGKTMNVTLTTQPVTSGDR